MVGKELGVPQIINDGVTIAKELNVVDEFENTGVCLIRQAALKTNEVSGDGTTTSTVLAHAITMQGLRHVASGANPVIVKRGIEKSTNFVIDKINDYAKPLRSDNDILNIATVAAGGDLEMGTLIHKAFASVGREGVVTIRESKAIQTQIELKDGLGLDNGFISSCFITDKNKRECILEHPYILLTGNVLSKIKDVLRVLELVTKTNRPLLIIGADIKQEALATLILNKTKGILNVVAVKAPSFGLQRQALLTDLATLTGGQVISSATGYSLQKISLDLLGRARYVRVKKEGTTIISDEHKVEVRKRCEQLRREIYLTDSTYEKTNLQERIAKLSGGVAVIKVGGATETEIKDRKLRIEDAINATKAAVEEGLIPGGGTLFAHLTRDLASWVTHHLSGDELLGGLAVVQAISSPLKKIALNSGESGTVVLKRVLDYADKLKTPKSLSNPTKNEQLSSRYASKPSAKKASAPPGAKPNPGASSAERGQQHDPLHKDAQKPSLVSVRSEDSLCYQDIRDIGYDGNIKKIVNVVDNGIVDPSKVARAALKNAASIAGMVLTTECIVITTSD